LSSGLVRQPRRSATGARIGRRLVYYHPSVGAEGNVAAAREVTIGKLNPTINVNLDLNLKASADLVVINPSYTFATPVFGGQFNVNVAGLVGQSTGEISGILTATSGGVVATRQGSISDSLTAVGDVIPLTSLRWNSGVNNWMVYGMGTFRPDRTWTQASDIR
jgi:hypothetical protein